MTAQRWWVKMAARWLARVGGVENHLRLAMLTLTGVSTATFTLRQYGHGRLAWPLIIIVVVSMAVYTYLYTEGGVWNQVSRDRQDLSTNYAAPTMLMDDTTIGVAAYVAINGEKPTREQREMIHEAVREQWEEFREGVPLEPQTEAD